ncbi:PqqD family protein [Subtercola endophyticus]|uniref:PqqD family protein n=1 Tax=Subtercola endophyticus TaxID=2895559 RepID=UPI0036F3888F
MTALSRETHVRRREHVAVVDKSDELIILALDQRSCEPLAISETGIEIWRSLTTSFQTISAIAALISGEMRVDSREIETDIIQFISVLVSKGVVERGDRA